MQGLSTVALGKRLVVKQFNLDDPLGLALFNAEHEAYKALQPHGIAPDFFAACDGPEPKAGRGCIVTPRLRGLRDVVAEAAAPGFEIRVDKEPAKAQWARRVARAIDKMHRAGVAHRDLNIGNIVVDEGEVKFIDLEFACRVDPARKPYDLYGPEASGIEPPEPHKALGISVWWSTPRDYLLALERWFGPLKGIL